MAELEIFKVENSRGKSKLMTNYDHFQGKRKINEPKIHYNKTVIFLPFTPLEKPYKL